MRFVNSLHSIGARCIIRDKYFSTFVEFLHNFLYASPNRVLSCFERSTNKSVSERDSQVLIGFQSHAEARLSIKARRRDLRSCGSK